MKKLHRKTKIFRNKNSTVHGFQKFRQLRFDKEFTKYYVRLLKSDTKMSESEYIMRNIEDCGDSINRCQDPSDPNPTPRFNPKVAKLQKLMKIKVCEVACLGKLLVGHLIELGILQKRAEAHDQKCRSASERYKVIQKLNRDKVKLDIISKNTRIDIRRNANGNWK